MCLGLPIECLHFNYFISKELLFVCVVSDDPRTISLGYSPLAKPKTKAFLLWPVIIWQQYSITQKKQEKEKQASNEKVTCCAFMLSTYLINWDEIEWLFDDSSISFRCI